MIKIVFVPDEIKGNFTVEFGFEVGDKRLERIVPVDAFTNSKHETKDVER